ncbi:hypothetical protein HaLaN_27542 [Haematococcus lacustris]|uniref:Uncharacterized protein n=1 Tax=Haematococcus lacustris TaxID=44745 RepID=A0A6A0AA03_HAELA|nr:hypothetical protein HaLaN_27542 [Haematococcus lacustris]
MLGSALFAPGPLQEGFRDLSLAIVFPDIARIGSEDAAMADTVKDVWTEARIRWYMSISLPAFKEEYANADAKLQHAEANMRSLLGKGT